MGLFDRVTVERPEFVCSEGHPLHGELFQTKGLGCTMGHWTLGETLSGEDGGYGEKPRRPFLGTISVYASCRQCPAFVQARTGNFCDCPVEFDVEIVDDVVRKVTRTSQSTAEWLREEPTRPWMAGCRGPMPWTDAHALHMAALAGRGRGEEDTDG